MSAYDRADSASFTPNLNLELVPFDDSPWHEREHNNWRIVDAIIGTYLNSIRIKGIWQNSTEYVRGDRVVDPDSGSVWSCLVPHISSASGTFAEERAANPTYWRETSVVATDRGEWQPNTDYFIGDYVYSGYKFAHCNVDHTSGTSFEEDINYWYILFDVEPTYIHLIDEATTEITSIKELAIVQFNNTADQKQLQVFAAIDNKQVQVIGVLEAKQEEIRDNLQKYYVELRGGLGDWYGQLSNQLTFIYTGYRDSLTQLSKDAIENINTDKQAALQQIEALRASIVKAGEDGLKDINDARDDIIAQVNAAATAAEEKIAGYVGTIEAEKDRLIGELTTTYTQLQGDLSDLADNLAAQVRGEGTAAINNIYTAQRQALEIFNAGAEETKTAAIKAIEDARDAALEDVREIVEGAAGPIIDEVKQEIEDAATAGVASVNTAVTNGTTAINTARDDAVSAINAARDDALNTITPLVTQVQDNANQVATDASTVATDKATVAADKTAVAEDRVAVEGTVDTVTAMHDQVKEWYDEWKAGGGSGGLTPLTANTTWYINGTDGNDTNTGLTAAQALLTIDEALTRANQIIPGPYTLTLSLRNDASLVRNVNWPIWANPKSLIITQITGASGGYTSDFVIGSCTIGSSTIPAGSTTGRLVIDRGAVVTVPNVSTVIAAGVDEATMPMLVRGDFYFRTHGAVSATNPNTYAFEVSEGGRMYVPGNFTCNSRACIFKLNTGGKFWCNQLLSPGTVPTSVIIESGAELYINQNVATTFTRNFATIDGFFNIRSGIGVPFSIGSSNRASGFNCVVVESAGVANVTFNVSPPTIDYVINVLTGDGSQATITDKTTQGFTVTHDVSTIAYWQCYAR